MLLALDPGLASCGAAVFTDAGRLVDADVFTSKPGRKPKGTAGAWAAHDHTRRVLELLAWLDVLNRHTRVDGPHLRVALEGIGSARGANALAQMGIAAGAIVAWSSLRGAVEISHTTPSEWRAELGCPGTRAKPGLSKSERAALKRDDDERLYAMLAGLPGGDQVEQFVVGHGRALGRAVHALDSFGIGQWFLQRRAAAIHARVA